MMSAGNNGGEQMSDADSNAGNKENTVKKLTKKRQAKVDGVRDALANAEVAMTPDDLVTDIVPAMANVTAYVIMRQELAEQVDRIKDDGVWKYFLKGGKCDPNAEVVMPEPEVKEVEVPAEVKLTDRQIAVLRHMASNLSFETAALELTADQFGETRRQLMKKGLVEKVDGKFIVNANGKAVAA
jgi:hypothetical protein